jgi:hypothetical protein
VSQAVTIVSTYFKFRRHSKFNGKNYISRNEEGEKRREKKFTQQLQQLKETEIVYKDLIILSCVKEVLHTFSLDERTKSSDRWTASGKEIEEKGEEKRVEEALT